VWAKTGPKKLWLCLHRKKKEKKGGVEGVQKKGENLANRKFEKAEQWAWVKSPKVYGGG